ncbi:MAG: hypothetical protein LBV12_08640, partial [Puniceicoccales bacterium]|nr:hypothetical protein [Puniceicoccales bacterium]
YLISSLIVQLYCMFEVSKHTLACSEAPEGFSRWTVRLLAQRIVELEILPAISREPCAAR